MCHCMYKDGDNYMGHPFARLSRKLKCCLNYLNHKPSSETETETETMRQRDRDRDRDRDNETERHKQRN